MNEIKCTYEVAGKKGYKHCPPCEGKVIVKMANVINLSPLCEAHSKWFQSSLGNYVEPLEIK